MKKISSKLTLSFLFLVSLALFISGSVFFISYKQVLNKSEWEGLENIANDISSYINKQNQHFENWSVYELLQEISSYEEVSIIIQDGNRRILHKITPDIERFLFYTKRLSDKYSDIESRTNRRHRHVAQILKNRVPPFVRKFNFGEHETHDGDLDSIQITVPAAAFPENFSSNTGNTQSNYLLSFFRPQRISEDFLNVAGWGLILSAFIAFGASIVAGIFLGKKITMPIISLKETALLMAEGNYSIRARVTTSDETADLAESFNVLGSKLEKRIQELSEERDSLRNFLVDASHELRTPLTTMLTSSEILNDHLYFSDPRLKDLYLQNHESILYMKELLDHLLSLSRIQGGIKEIHRQHCDLRELAEEASRYIQGNIQFDIPASLPTVWVDRLSCVQIFRNCFENSLNAGANHITVRVGVREDKGKTALSIIDNGRGIRAADLNRVTKRFFSGEDSDGSGLGLAIVEGIVKLHGGYLKIISPVTNTSTGTEIRILIPDSENSMS